MAQNILAQQNQIRLKKWVNILCEEKTAWSWLRWKNCSQETTAEGAKQCLKALVGQGRKRLDNRAEEQTHLDWRIKVRNLSVQYFGHMWGDELVKELWLPTVKHVGGSLIERQLQSRGFVPGEEQMKKDSLSKHTAATHVPIRYVVCESRICTHAS